jgi:hypothetical protein
VTTGGWLVGAVVGWSGWLVPQPAVARLATSRAVAMVRMGRMMLIPFGLRMLLESCCDGYRSDRSQI